LHTVDQGHALVLRDGDGGTAPLHHRIADPLINPVLIARLEPGLGLACSGHDGGLFIGGHAVELVQVHHVIDVAVKQVGVDHIGHHIPELPA
jgi:hypothetical protein